MSFCTGCGNEVKDGAKFCGSCGARQEECAARKANVGEMSKEECYDLLGIPRYSTADDVKMAYRQLAVRWHPDKNPGDGGAAEKFREITDACKKLLDIKENFMPFCTNCGADITEELKFCPNCGIALDGRPQNMNRGSGAGTTARTKPDIPPIMYTLSGREALCAVFWIIVAGLQALLVVLVIIFGAVNGFDGNQITSVVVIGIISVVNFIYGFKSLLFSKTILSAYPRGVLERYDKKDVTPIVYNAILFGVNVFYGNALWAVICGLATGVAVFAWLAIHNLAKTNWEEIFEYLSQCEEA